MYSRVPECQVTTYYYVGFAYLMMRRYQDAIRVFANILLYIQRTKSMFQRTTYKYEMVRELQPLSHRAADSLALAPTVLDKHYLKFATLKNTSYQPGGGGACL